MSRSVAFTSSNDRELSDHLLQYPGQKEDLCFAAWFPSSGRERITALIHEVILPKEGERTVRISAAFESSYFERALGIAMKRGGGLAFMHSHLGPGWQDMSDPDFLAEQLHAPATKAATRLPLVGLTLGTDGTWSGRFWEKNHKGTFLHLWCESVRVVGEDGLRVDFNDNIVPIPIISEEQSSTVSAWGELKQAELSRLKIAVIGLGSVGSLVAESLARMGVIKVTLVDFDIVKRHNLDRHLHAGPKDIGKFKIDVVAGRINEIATGAGFSAQQFYYSITEEEGYKAALDCDIVFSCVDKPWPRQVMNFIAYAHLIPVVDGGIAVKKKENNELLSADWKAHVAMPTRRCLECLEQYSAADVELERRGVFNDPHYIESLDKNHPLKRNENVFAFSSNLASLEVLQMLSMVIAPFGINDPGELNYHFTTQRMDFEQGKSCTDYCPFVNCISQGDTLSNPIRILHTEAENNRRTLLTDQ